MGADEWARWIGCICFVKVFIDVVSWVLDKILDKLFKPSRSLELIRIERMEEQAAAKRKAQEGPG